MSDNSERQSGNAARAMDLSRDAKRVLPPKAIRALADEVVARLADRVRGFPASPRVEAGTGAFCDALLSQDPLAAQRIVDQERQDGVPVEAICLHMLADAARRLGVLWEEDRVSFLALTVAIGRIFEIMRGLRQEIPVLPYDPQRLKRAFFASVPEEDHTLGVTMAASVLRSKGWDIVLRTGSSHAELVEEIGASDHNIIGLSSGHADGVAALMRLMVALRLTNPNALIVVCGQIVQQVPGLSQMINADAVIPDSEDAFEVMDRLVNQDRN